MTSAAAAWRPGAVEAASAIRRSTGRGTCRGERAPAPSSGSIVRCQLVERHRPAGDLEDDVPAGRVGERAVTAAATSGTAAKASPGSPRARNQRAAGPARGAPEEVAVELQERARPDDRPRRPAGAQVLLGGGLHAEQLDRVVRCGAEHRHQDDVRADRRRASTRQALPSRSTDAGLTPRPAKPCTAETTASAPADRAGERRRAGARRRPPARPAPGGRPGRVRVSTRTCSPRAARGGPPVGARAGRCHRRPGSRRRPLGRRRTAASTPPARSTGSR